MFKKLRARWHARLVRRHPIDDTIWCATCAVLPMLAGLRADELAELRRLATLFIRQKTYIGAHGFGITPAMKAAVAVQACLPILHLGLDYYREWRTIVLYPGAFVAPREFEDEAGVVHAGFEELDGESMAGGPMALSWDEVDPEREPGGPNVVLHECAHKLDELTGEPNGLPPLHADMSVAAWADAFSAAYERFSQDVVAYDEAIDGDDADLLLPLDDYAATDPAEFFAVMTEAFFESPDDVAQEFPMVYAQLVRFFRQDPAARRTIQS